METSTARNSVYLVLLIVATAVSGAPIMGESQVSSDGCSIMQSSVDDFYSSIRKSNDEDFQYPDYKTTLEALWDVPRGPRMIVLFYNTIFNDVFAHLSELRSEYFSWCIHLYSSTDDSLHGCIQGNQTTGTSDFLNLGILDDLTVEEAHPYVLTVKNGILTDLLQGALVSVTLKLPWLNHTIGVYYTLVPVGAQPVNLQITNFPRQDTAFLVKGEKKALNCDIISSNSTSQLSWSHGGKTVQKVDTENLNSTFPVSYSSKEVDIGNCLLTDSPPTKTTLSLSFDSPLMSDTGEYSCSAKDVNSQLELQGKTLYISVVFLDFPSSDFSLILGKPSNLLCTVKAPSNATVYWAFNGKQINIAKPQQQQQSIDEGSSGCVQAAATEGKQMDGSFSIFTSTLQICSVTEKDVGKYTCMVEYSVPSSEDVQTAQLHFDASVKTPATLVSSVPVSLDEMKEMAEMEQQDISCLLQENRTKRAEFYSAVRSKHGFADTRIRSFRPTVLRSSSVRCFIQSECPGSEPTWCFNMYHPTKSIEICWDASSNVLNMTQDASLLGLTDYMSVDECRGDSCMSLQDTPFFLDAGLLTCTVESSTCVAKSFTSITVEYVGIDSESPKIEFHNSSSDLVLGQQNIYLLSAVYPTDPIIFFFSFGDGLNVYSNDSFVNPIPQNGPFCEVTEGCQPASSRYDSQKDERIRVYSHMVTDISCPATSRTFYAWLVIDDARESDAYTRYSFSASVYVYQPYPIPTMVTSKLNLNLTPVEQQTGSGDAGLGEVFSS